MTEGTYRYYIVERSGDLYRYEIQDSLLKRRVRDTYGHDARFLSEQDARAAVPARDTDPDLCWGS